MAVVEIAKKKAMMQLLKIFGLIETVIGLNEWCDGGWRSLLIGSEINYRGAKGQRNMHTREGGRLFQYSFFPRAVFSYCIIMTWLQSLLRVEDH